MLGAVAAGAPQAAINAVKPTKKSMYKIRCLI